VLKQPLPLDLHGNPWVDKKIALPRQLSITIVSVKTGKLAELSRAASPAGLASAVLRPWRRKVIKGFIPGPYLVIIDY
jgi:hypothetical protein